MKDKAYKAISKGTLFYEILAIFLCILSACLTIYIAFILKDLIEISIIGDTPKLLSFLLKVIFYAIFLFAIRVVASAFTSLFIKKGITNLKSFLTQSFLHKEVSNYSDKNTGDYVSVLSNDITTIETAYFAFRISIFTNLALFIGSLIGLSIINYKMLLVVIIASLLPILNSIIFGNKVVQYRQKVSQLNQKFTSTIKDFFSGFLVIKNFGIDSEINVVFNETNNSLENEKHRARLFSDIVAGASEFVVIILVLTVFFYGSYLISVKQLTISSLVAVVQLINYVMSPMGVIPSLLTEYAAAKKLIENAAAIACESPDMEIVPTTALNEFNHEILFSNVSFKHKNQEEETLKDINLQFELGKSYLIVGDTGSGKSTLAGLLLGYYPPNAGSVTIDGIEISTIYPESRNELFSVMLQNVFIFDASISDNITLFKEFSDSVVAAAIKSAGLEPVVVEKGLDFMCGENGVFLSAGEKQRIAIARMLILDAKIIVMDEATSSLDNHTAHAIEETVLSLSGVTKVIVAHRFNNNLLRRYDSIIYLKGGRVIEHGTADELIERKEYFYSLLTVSA